MIQAYAVCGSERVLKTCLDYVALPCSAIIDIQNNGEVMRYFGNRSGMRERLPVVEGQLLSAAYLATNVTALFLYYYLGLLNLYRIDEGSGWLEVGLASLWVVVPLTTVIATLYLAQVERRAAGISLAVVAGMVATAAYVVPVALVSNTPMQYLAVSERLDGLCADYCPEQVWQEHLERRRGGSGGFEKQAPQGMI